MNTALAQTLSDAARRRMLSVPGEPLFYASWDHVIMIHYETDASLLQRSVPFSLDLREGKAFVSLVGFTMRRMRPRRGGRLGKWLFKPIATHEFMNVRTYVQVNGEPGIYFLAEWLSNRLSVPLGPPVFGLPYRHGRIAYEHDSPGEGISGHVAAGGACISYHGFLASAVFAPCAGGSRDEFLMERYTAFTKRGRSRRMFRVWHAPWRRSEVELHLTAIDLLKTTGPWLRKAHYVGATYSPGVDVWMGRPLQIVED